MCDSCPAPGFHHGHLCWVFDALNGHNEGEEYADAGPHK